MDLFIIVYMTYMLVAAFVAFAVTTGMLGLGGWGVGAWAGGAAMAVPFGLLGLGWSFSVKNYSESLPDVLLVMLLSGLGAVVMAEARYVYAARRGQMPALLAQRRWGVTFALMVLVAITAVWWGLWLNPKLSVA